MLVFVDQLNATSHSSAVAICRNCLVRMRSSLWALSQRTVHVGKPNIRLCDMVICSL